MTSAPVRSTKAKNLALAIVMITGSTPTVALGRQSQPPLTTATPSTPSNFRKMTAQEVAKYRDWVAQAETAYKAGHWARAEIFYRKMLICEEAIFGPTHHEVAVTLGYIGRAVDQQGRTIEAEHLFRRSLEIREKRYGPDHVDTSNGLGALALNLATQDRYSEAEVLNRRALAINEQKYGAYHKYTSTILGNLALNLNKQDRAVEAEPLFRRRLAIEESINGINHIEVADALINLGNSLSMQGRSKEAESFFRRALTIRENRLGPNDGATADALNELANNLSLQNRLAEAEFLFRRALAINEKIGRSDDRYTSAGIYGLAHNLVSQSRINEAERLFRRALMISEKWGSSNVTTAQRLYGLAFSLSKQGKYSEANLLFRRSLAINERLRGHVHSQTAIVVNTLARNLDAQGKYAEAEPLFKKAYNILEKLYGSDHIEVYSAIVGMARNLDSQGRFEESAPWYQRAQDIIKNKFDSNHPQNVINLVDLSANLSISGRFKEAETLARRALIISEKNSPFSANVMSNVLGHLATILNAQSRYVEAEGFARRALAIREKSLERDGLEIAGALQNITWSLQGQNDLGQAESLYRRALNIYEKALGFYHPYTASSAEALASLNLGYSPSSALTSARKALDVRRAVAAREGGGVDEGAQAQLSVATGYAGLLFVRSALSLSKAGGGTASLTAESFSAAQSIGSSGAGRALARGTALASLDARGQDMARAWESALAARSNLDRRFTAAAGVAGPDGDAQRARLSQERVQLDGEVRQAEERLRSAYPAYFNLIAPGPVSLAELQQSVAGQQALLGPNEALILMTPGDTRLPKGQQRGVVFAVTREGVAWTEIGIDPSALLLDICRVRTQLDPGNVTPCETEVAPATASTVKAVSTDARAITRAPGSPGAQTGAQRGYDRATARRLYDALFGAPEIARLIAGKKEWIISPQGALLSLPFAALVAGDYSGDDADVAALRSTPWLGMTRALSVIPEVSSLKALRGLSRPARSTQTPFFGMGDPDFARGASGAAPATTVAAATSGGAPGKVRSYFRDAGADIGAVSTLARLPGTKIEIELLAKSLKAIPGSILLGDDATEKNLRARSNDGSLAGARVVAFATHGLIAGDLGRSLAQPALAFTPPAPAEGTVTEANDGLLTAAEAATLKLAADWVILSACNTASGGDNSADGLTGLARAFFYAGADTLLVSHWRVRDDAAARLTTRAVEIAQTTGSQKPSRAAALQQSMRELMNDTTQDKSDTSFAHPAAWAPFILIGVER